MLGLDNYGSGSGSESDNENQAIKTPSAAAEPPSSSGSSKISLPPPKTTKRPKKITISLPSLLKGNDEEKDDLDEDRPAAKRQKIGGAGVSSLLSMLPAPKQKVPLASQLERVLGGGKVSEARPSAPLAHNRNIVEEGDEEEDEELPTSTAIKRTTPPLTKDESSSLPFLPPSLAKGRANISLEDNLKMPARQALPKVSAVPPVDFLSLGNSLKTTTPSATSSSSTSIPSLSSAPSIPSFEPPEPTRQDQHPGYYQLPSGQWAAYAPEYYGKFMQKWQREYDAYVRGLEKGMLKGFEGYEEDAPEVDAMKEMEKAKVEIKDREERKALTKGAQGPVEQPKMKFNPSKLSGIARSRHQLSTLLRDAYENREALEERIAEGRRNRKEAGNKYGF